MLAAADSFLSNPRAAVRQPREPPSVEEFHFHTREFVAGLNLKERERFRERDIESEISLPDFRPGLPATRGGLPELVTSGRSGSSSAVCKLSPTIRRDRRRPCTC